MKDLSKIKTELRGLYREFGNRNYIGEDISQLEHALQTADILKNSLPFCPSLIVSGLLHDVGHLVALKRNIECGEFGVKNHEKIGSDYLRELGLPKPIPEIVESHVEIKRYLTRNKNYYLNLSRASKETLKEQGGPMTDQEAKEYEDKNQFEIRSYLMLRNADDQAKVVGKATPSFDFFLNYLDDIK
jgi:putative nucleotidyltransferase with HDIG domain